MEDLSFIAIELSCSIPKSSKYITLNLSLSLSKEEERMNVEEEIQKLEEEIHRLGSRQTDGSYKVSLLFLSLSPLALRSPSYLYYFSSFSIHLLLLSQDRKQLLFSLALIVF